MLDDLRSYLQMASGLTEVTTSKAKEVVTGLLSTGMSLTSKAVPAPEMMGQVQELADDLVSTSKNTRDMLTGMIRAEVDKAVGRMGFVREDELAALRRHVQRLERQLDAMQSASGASTWPAPAEPAPPAAPTPAAASPEADSPVDVVDDVVAVVVDDVDVVVPEASAPAADAAEAPAPAAEAPPKKKKKKILVDPSEAHPHG